MLNNCWTFGQDAADPCWLAAVELPVCDDMTAGISTSSPVPVPVSEL